MTHGDQGHQSDLERIRELAGELAAADSGPAGELACALADAVLSIGERADALWRLITAIVSATGTPAGTQARPPPAEFLQALSSARGSGPQGVRLSIGGQEWVAAISPDQRPADPARAWAAVERLAKSASQAGDQDQDPGDL
jgi:hypothetical protein